MRISDWSSDVCSSDLAWSFDLDGRMLAAPEAHQFACLDKSTTRLLPVRCELWRGLVFINLDPDAAPLAEFMAPALTYTQGFPLEDLVLHGHFIIEFDCNWKQIGRASCRESGCM